MMKRENIGSAQLHSCQAVWPGQTQNSKLIPCLAQA